MKSGIFVGLLQKTIYTSYKNFDLQRFNIALKSELEKLNNSAYIEFETIFYNFWTDMHLLKWKCWSWTITLLWRKTEEKQPCIDLNLKIVSTNTAVVETGATIKPNKITA